jgi:curli production assembly/transport component CsgF
VNESIANYRKFMRKLFYLFIVALLPCVAGVAKLQAQDLVYEAKNPAFGGNTFNYQWLQSSATAQDKLKDPDALAPASRITRNPLQDFTDNLNRQILNQLSRKLITAQFGEDSLEPGSYTIGNYQIDVTEGSGGVKIVIVDAGSGDQTTVTVPFF